MEDGFGFRNNSSELLAAFYRRVTSEVAGLEKLAERSEGRLGNAPRHETFLDDSFSDGRGGEIEAFAQLLLQQVGQGGEELIGVVGGGMAAKFIQTFPGEVGDQQTPAQFGFIREMIVRGTQIKEG